MNTTYYNIGEVSKMFDLPISTLHYYDREGLFPNLNRSKSSVRKFDDSAVESLRLIECLKKTGMEIKDIKKFIIWCQQGPSTYKKRREMFNKQRENVETEIEHLNQVLDMIKFKCWYYDTAIADGNEDRLKNSKPEDMPEDVRKAWKNAHR